MPHSDDVVVDTFAAELRAKPEELRVLSIGASLLTLVFVMAARGHAPGDAPPMIFMLMWLELAALVTYVAARAFDWGMRTGWPGVIVLLVVSGCIWPLISKPIPYAAGVVGRALPRATSTRATLVAIAIAALASIVLD